MKKINRIYSYMGSKARHLDLINKIIKYIFKNEDTKKYNYHEPFLGSGVIFLNLEKEFKRYYLSDIQKDLLLFFKFYNKITKRKLNKVVKYDKEYFNIENNKEGYYKFRNKYNIYRKWNEYKAIMFFMIVNSCFCNMIRFGPNGCNSPFGNRKYKDKIKDVLSSIKYCKNKNIFISLNGFEKNLKYVNKNSFLFLDPPYYKRSRSYKWNEKNIIKLHNFLVKNKNIKFLYFNTINKFTKKLINKINCEYKIVNKIRNASSTQKKSVRVKEIIIFRK